MPGSDAITRLVVNTLSWQACRGQYLGAIQARRCFAAVPETLYEVLGVARTAKKLSIKAAFRKVAMALSSAPDPKGHWPSASSHTCFPALAVCTKHDRCLQKARELHPDISGDIQSAAFVSLLQAYEVQAPYRSAYWL